MDPTRESFGTLIPVGGGDPIPLVKAELTVGRRPACDIRLDFENVSGKHAVLTLINGLWHVRDMASTNGTSVNGSRLSSPHSVMPEDEVGFAGHLFTLDYVPSGPESLISSHQTLEEDVQDERRRHSLMELAGLDTDAKAPRVSRPKTAPVAIERLSVDEAEFDDTVPKHFKPKPAAKAKKKAEDEDDFLKLIEDEVVKKPE
ncbi:FHA domain-containing protein [Planctomyces sp. SH-PL62]|uniref:FHA domain-containing protein n=1 Tax=Planctomyces sp. SH-PL62 TaxID=1636152 RepID=UPI00078D99B3|nr:FHA domain-containing protein [Planctomyces sp. SH-PL62]AMV36767.1 FHA domain protein [Planctomyces sp. SH-PL62]